MSLLDIRQAKEALTWRLKEWAVEGDPAALAASFIDDLVTKGWRMDAAREDRPQPLRPSEACSTHLTQPADACVWCSGKVRAYDEDTAPSTQRPRPADPATKTAAIAAARAELVAAQGVQVAEAMATEVLGLDKTAANERTDHE